MGIYINGAGIFFDYRLKGEKRFDAEGAEIGHRDRREERKKAQEHRQECLCHERRLG